MRGCLRLIFLAALAGLGQVGAGTSASTTELDGLITQIREVSEYSPMAARALVERANTLADQDGSFAARAKLAAATAPYTAQARGYIDARKALLDQVRAAQEAEGSEELVPLLRIAIGDIASRHGDDATAVNQLTLALAGVGEATTVGTKQLLLYQTIRLLWVAEDITHAWEVISVFDFLGAREDPVWRDRLLLMEARLHGLEKDIEGMRQALNVFSAAVSDSTDPMTVKSFWILKGYLALQEGSVTQAKKFLEEAQFIEREGFQFAKDGTLYLLEALLAKRQGKSEIEVHTLLEQSRLAYMKSGEPGGFHLILSLLMRSSLKDDPEKLDEAFLVAMSEFTYQEGSLFPLAYAHFAKAELLRRQGDLEQAYQELLKGNREWMKANERMNQFQFAWSSRPAWLMPAADGEGASAQFYMATLLLLLVVLVLFLLLRVRTEHVMNASLREAVEKSRLAEKAAEDANRLKSQFLSNISHEIKTPMSGLVGMTSILEELVSDPVQRKYLKTIQDCSRNLLVLVNDLLDLGRMESNRIEIDHSPFRPTETLQYCEQVVIQSAQSKGLTLTLRTSPELPDLLVGDSIRLGQILVNLLTNAIKFTEVGSVVLETEYNPNGAATGELVVAIKDTGIGIEPDRLESVFYPFNNGESRGTHPAEGSGLGLAISKKLAELMGGSITINSTIGKGSTFTVRLPFPMAPKFADHD